MGKIVKMSFERKTCRKWANGLKICDSEKLKKIWTPGVGLPPHPGAIYMFITIIFKDIYSKSQVSIYRTISPLVFPIWCLCLDLKFNCINSWSLYSSFKYDIFSHKNVNKMPKKIISILLYTICSNRQTAITKTRPCNK